MLSATNLKLISHWRFYHQHIFCTFKRTAFHHKILFMATSTGADYIQLHIPGTESVCSHYLVKSIPHLHIANILHSFFSIQPKVSYGIPKHTLTSGERAPMATPTLPWFWGTSSHCVVSSVSPNTALNPPHTTRFQGYQLRSVNKNGRAPVHRSSTAFVLVQTWLNSIGNMLSRITHSSINWKYYQWEHIFQFFTQH